MPRWQRANGGWESFESITTGKDLGRLIVEIKETLDAAYEYDDTVRFVLRK